MPTPPVSNPYAEFQKPAVDPYAEFQQPMKAHADPETVSAAPNAAPQTTANKILGVNPVGDTLGSIGSHLKNLVAGPYHAFTDAPRNPEEQAMKGADASSGLTARTLGQFGLGAARMFVEPTTEALRDSAKLRKMGGPQSSLTAPSSYDSQGNNIPTAGSRLIDALPIYGPWSRGYSDEVHTKGFLPATAGLATDVLGAEALGKVGKVGEGARGLLAGDVDKPMNGSSVTPRMRYDAARDLGVNLDAADAVGSGPLRLVKKFNRDSLVGSPVYDKAAAQNIAAIRAGQGKILSDMSPLEPESGGHRIFDKLRADQAGLRDGADAQFKQLDEMTGGAPVLGAASVGKAAQQLINNDSAFYSKYPTYKPDTAISALKDLSKVGDTSSYSDLQRLRSGTRELTAANPDYVKDYGTGMLQQMTGNLDNAITDKGLSPEQVPIFRDANAKWADLKSTYDNPSSPFYQASRTRNPETLSAGFGSKTAADMDNIKARIGEDGLGAMQRGVTSKLLKTDANGDSMLRSFGQRFNAMPQPYRDSLYGPEFSQRLQNLSRATQSIGEDFNPSGSAKQLQKVTEGGSLLSTFAGNPTGLAPLLQYPVAKIMNSPRFVNWLMENGESSGTIASPLPMGGDKPSPLKPISTGAGGVSAFTQAPQSAAPPPMMKTLPASAESVPALDGSATELHTPDQVHPARYRVMEADDLQPSHNSGNFKPNPQYPANVQERDYLNNKDLQVGVMQHAQEYKPAMTVNDNPDGVNGPPVITPDGTVLGGNGRVMSTQRLYNADGGAYKNYLKQRAGQFGMDAGDIDQMRKPVLVREVNPPGGVEGMRNLATQLNKPMTNSLTPSERSVSMGKSVSPQTLQMVRQLLNEAGGGASLRDVMADPARSHALLGRMQEDGVIGPQQTAEFSEKAGGLNADGKNLFEKALMGSIMGDSAAMDAAPKHVMAKLNASIGPLAEMASRSDEWNVLPALRRAIVEHGKMAASGIGVEDHMNQSSMFDRPLTPVESHLTRLLEGNSNDVREGFSKYGADAQYAIPGQSSFLGPQAHEAYNHAFGTKLTPEEFGQR